MDGIIVINKPQGFTSQDVVSKTKKTLNIKKAGHTGTLDPLATGVLPVLVGNYTKLSKYLIEHDKIYRAKIKFGEKRETGDLEGKVIESSNIKIENIDEIKKVLNSMIGKQMQIPPMYSAIKVNGKKLYEYARNGEKIDIPAREIEIYKLNFISFEEKNQILEIEVSCSKGTYIRTLCEDISQKLGTVGFMLELKRIQVDKFKIENALSFEDLEKNKENIDKYLIKMEEVFDNFPKIDLPVEKKELLLNGVKLKGFEKLKEGTYNIYIDRKYIGLGIIRERNIKKRYYIIDKKLFTN